MKFQYLCSAACGHIYELVLPKPGRGGEIEYWKDRRTPNTLGVCPTCGGGLLIRSK